MKNNFLWRFIAVAALAAILIAAAVAAAQGLDGAKITGDAAKGKVAFDKLCAPCHGYKGDGAGPKGLTMNPKPRNFTDKAVMSQVTDARILKVIRDGKDVLPLVGMTGWKDKLTMDDINDVAAYVRSFAK